MENRTALEAHNHDLERVLRVQVAVTEATQRPGWFEKFRETAQRAMTVTHPGVAESQGR